MKVPPCTRTIYGRTNVYEPSRFLDEIPDELKEELAFRRRRFDDEGGFGGCNDYDGYGSGSNGYGSHGNGSGYGGKRFGGSFGYGGYSRNAGGFTAKNSPQAGTIEQQRPAGGMASAGSFAPHFSSSASRPAAAKGQPMSGLEALSAVRSINPAIAKGVQMGTKSLARPDMSIQWKTGDKAAHSKWGTGTVVGVSGSGEEREIQINFPGIGLKKLMQKYAPLKKV